MVKLILSDVDETLMPLGHKQVPDHVIEAFHAALDAGIEIGPASGRGFAWIPPFFGEDEACCATALATNGSQIYLHGELIHEVETIIIDKKLAKAQKKAVAHHILYVVGGICTLILALTLTVIAVLGAISWIEDLLEYWREKKKAGRSP